MFTSLHFTSLLDEKDHAWGRAFPRPPLRHGSVPELDLKKARDGLRGLADVGRDRGRRRLEVLGRILEERHRRGLAAAALRHEPQRLRAAAAHGAQRARSGHVGRSGDAVAVGHAEELELRQREFAERAGRFAERRVEAADVERAERAEAAVERGDEPARRRTAGEVERFEARAVRLAEPLEPRIQRLPSRPQSAAARVNSQPPPPPHVPKDLQMIAEERWREFQERNQKRKMLGSAGRNRERVLPCQATDGAM